MRLAAARLTSSNPVNVLEIPEAPLAKGPNSLGIGLGLDLSIVWQFCAEMGVQMIQAIADDQLTVTLLITVKLSALEPIHPENLIANIGGIFVPINPP